MFLKIFKKFNNICPILNDFNDILILINVRQKLKENAQYIFYLHKFHQRLPNMVKRLFADEYKHMYC
jgi:hypothetical protein